MASFFSVGIISPARWKDDRILGAKVLHENQFQSKNYIIFSAIFENFNSRKIPAPAIHHWLFPLFFLLPSPSDSHVPSFLYFIADAANSWRNTHRLRHFTTPSVSNASPLQPSFDKPTKIKSKQRSICFTALLRTDEFHGTKYICIEMNKHKIRGLGSAFS